MLTLATSLPLSAQVRKPLPSIKPAAVAHSTVALPRRGGLAPLLRAAVPVRDPARPSIPANQRRYIVTLADAANQDACVRTHGIKREKSLRHALNCFVACLDDATVARLRNRLDVLGIEEDMLVAQDLAQTVPTGVKRMGVEQFPAAMINGLDERIDVDVAVMDSGGVQPDHPDLYVYQQAAIFGPFTPTDHATACGGVVGALDNAIGAVGVAPGARIWSISMSYGGGIYTSDIRGGFDYVLQHADEIEVVSCSFGSFYGTSFSRRTYEPYIQRCVDRGVVVVCGAGNDAGDIAGPNGVLDDGNYTDNTLPAGLPGSVAVSAVDPVTDRFASYSNFSASNHNGRAVFSPGAAIDVAGPTNVLTTALGSTYTSNFFGTSCATPHVSGLVALYIAKHGRATDAAGVYRIRQAIVDAAQPQTQWQSANTYDLDSNHEGLAQAALAWALPESPFTRMVRSQSPDSFTLDFGTNQGYVHTLQHVDSLGTATPWSDLVSLEGDGTDASVEHLLPGWKHFYRLQARPVPWPPLALDTTSAANLGSVGPAAAGKYYLETRGVPGALVGDGQNTALRQLPTNAGSRVVVPYLPTLNPATAFSVEVWARPALGGIAPYIYLPYLAGAQEQGGGWLLSQIPSVGSVNGFTFSCFTGATTSVNASVTLTVETGKWYHVVGVFDGANVVLYIDGVAAATTAIPGGQTYQPNTSRATEFGNRGRGGGWFEGDLDEAAIYSYALTATQVQAHYQAGTNPTPPIPYQQVILTDTPAGYWRLNEP